MTRWDLPGRTRRAALAAVVATAIVAPLGAQLRDEPNLDALYRIKEEATSNSKVMETLSYLTDVHGPRLTNSPLMHEAAAPVFESWMKPFHNIGMQTLTIRDTGGTDHQAFDAVGLPGFQFIQDPLEYSARTHHTNLDLYERAVPQDLMQNAIVVATFAYQAANRDALFPRKPLPKPRPAQPGPGGRPATQTSPQ